MVIPKATKQEAAQITNLAKDADMKLKCLEDARLNYIMKAEAKYKRQLYNRLLKKYNAGTLSWNETAMLDELKKADANGELEPSTEVSDGDIEKLKTRVLAEYNSLPKILQKLGVNLSPVSKFDEKTILVNIKSAIQELKSRKNPEPEQENPEKHVKKEILKSVYDATPIVELQLEEDIPGIGRKGEKMRVYKDGYSVF